MLRRLCGVAHLTGTALLRSVLTLVVTAAIVFVITSIYFCPAREAWPSTAAGKCKQQLQDRAGNDLFSHSADGKTHRSGGVPCVQKPLDLEKDCKRCLKRWRKEKAGSQKDRGFSNEAGSLLDQQPVADTGAATGDGKGGNCEKVMMTVNGEYTQTVCVRHENGKKSQGRQPDVLLPFTFVKKYFDMPGNVEIGSGGDITLTHSHGRLYKPDTPYQPSGPYLNFENSSVELRGKLQCIDGVESVPRSQRDDAKAYFYPIQIAQYGLKHYSLLKSHGETAETVLLHVRKQLNADGDDTENNSPGARKGNEDKTADISIDLTHDPKIYHRQSGLHPPVLEARFRFSGKATISVHLKAKFYQQNSLSPKVYVVHYTGGTEAASKPVLPVRCDMKSKEIYYDLGRSRHWRTIARHLHVDLLKGIFVCEGRNARSSNGLNEHVVVGSQVLKVLVRGSHQVSVLRLNGSAHEHTFMSAANWFLAHQDQAGSWVVPVERTMSSGRHRKDAVMPLKPPWRSAMAQGQGISVLVRAFHHTGQKKYLSAALNATKPFHQLAKDGGVQAVFMDQYKWFEEYPTNPPTFVLNGFMSSLIGLYDLWKVAGKVEGTAAAKDAETLFKEGFKSLHAMIPLYDMGSGSVYDLRHFTAKQAPNLARAEYHVTHLNQLATFCSVFPDDALLKRVYTRWLSYHNGHRAKHN